MRSRNMGFGGIDILKEPLKERSRRTTSWCKVEMHTGPRRGLKSPQSAFQACPRSSSLYVVQDCRPVNGLRHQHSLLFFEDILPVCRLLEGALSRSLIGSLPALRLHKLYVCTHLHTYMDI